MQMVILHLEGVPYRRIAKPAGTTSHAAVQRYVRDWIAENGLGA